MSIEKAKPEPTETNRPKMLRQWYDGQGDTPGRYLYFTHITPKGKRFASREEALWEYINKQTEQIKQFQEEIEHLKRILKE